MVALASLVVLFGGVLRGQGAEPAPATATAPAPPSVSPEAALAGGTQKAIARLQASLRRNPSDADSFALLGLAYEQRARETADPAYYPKADGVLHRALALSPRQPLAVSGLASLSLSRHRFRDALALARRALALDRNARNYGYLGDALVELGRYDAAFRTFDTMARLEPGLPAYARISYARELLGHPAAAIPPMKAAVSASGGQPEALAWSETQLGKLYFLQGRLEPAERAYLTALRAFPGYVYAIDALAQVEAAHGRYGRAIRLERIAADRVPLPQFVASLVDLYRAAGKPAPARREISLMGAIQRVLAANGVRTDLEVALFDVDHGLRLPQALALARAAQRDRPSIDADDVLAWALARNGRCGEALGYSERALRLGTKDALKFFHRGMIERCLGDGPDARVWFRRALELNPYFSVHWAPVARRYAR